MSHILDQLPDIRGNLAPNLGTDPALKRTRDTKEALSQSQDQVVQAEQHLSRLKTQHRRLEREAEQLTLRLSGPINRLPAELLGRIFVLACEGEYVRIHIEDDESHRSTALVLAEVCRRWRAMVISLRSLWTHFDLDVGKLESFWSGARYCGPASEDRSDSDDGFDHEYCSDEGGVQPDPAQAGGEQQAKRREASFCAYVQTVLRRSLPSQALDIRAVRPFGGDLGYDGFASALERGILHSNRIKKLHCTNLAFGFFDAPFEFPVLEDLQLINYAPADRLDPVPLSLPQLSRLSLINPCCDKQGRIFSDVKATWSALTTFSLFWNKLLPVRNHPHPADLLNIFAEMPNLTVARINFGVPSCGYHPIDPTPTILLPLLHTFEVQDPAMGALQAKFMGAIQAPLLARFDYFFTLEDQGIWAEAPIMDDATSLTQLLQSSLGLKTVNIGFCQDMWFLDPVSNFPLRGYWLLEFADIKFEDQALGWDNMVFDFQTYGATLRNAVAGAEWPERGYVEDLVGWIKDNTVFILDDDANGPGEVDVADIGHIFVAFRDIQKLVNQGTWSLFTQLELL